MNSLASSTTASKYYTGKEINIKNPQYLDFPRQGIRFPDFPLMFQKYSMTSGNQQASGNERETSWWKHRGYF